MVAKSSIGNIYTYNPIDNSIVDGRMDSVQIQLTFKPLEEITELHNVSSFTIGVTEQCNLRCSYCCYSGAYKEHRRHSANRLSIEQITSIIEFILRYSASKEISVDFYGGEALLEFDWIKTFVHEAKGNRSIHWQFEVSTNGLLLSPDKIDWLVTNQFKIFVSVDGIGHCHDNCRKDIKGRPTYSTINANLSYIKEHYSDFWEKNVHIMMTIHDIANLSVIADSWESSDLFNKKIPYRISEVATVYNDKTPKLDEASELHIYLPLIEWYKDHPKNSVMSTFFNIWLAEWINRPIGEIEPEIEYPTCVPYNRKLYIDAMGSIGICERISDNIRFGSITDGIDFSKLNEVRHRSASFIDQSCSNCEIARVCDICPDVLKIPETIKETYCHNQKVMQRIKFRCFCELAEADFIKNLWE